MTKYAGGVKMICKGCKANWSTLISDLQKADSDWGNFPINYCAICGYNMRSD